MALLLIFYFICAFAMIIGGLLVFRVLDYFLCFVVDLVTEATKR